MMKNHYGTAGGYLSNHKNITNTHIPTKGTAHGKIFRSCHQANLKDGHSLWMQPHPPTTHVARYGSSAFVSIISQWDSSKDLLPSLASAKTRALLAGLVALARHTNTPVRVIVQLTTVWAVWFGRTPTREPHTKTSWSMSQTRTTKGSQCCMSVAAREHPKHREMSHNSDEDNETQRWRPGKGRTIYMTRNSQNGNRCLMKIT